MRKLIYILLPIIFFAFGAPKCKERQDSPCELWLEYVKQNWKFDSVRKQYTMIDIPINDSIKDRFVESEFDFIFNQCVKNKGLVGYPKQKLIDVLGSPTGYNLKTQAYYVFAMVNKTDKKLSLRRNIFRTIRIDRVGEVPMIKRYYYTLTENDHCIRIE